MPGVTVTANMTLGKRQAAMEPQQQYQEQTIDLCRKEFSSQTIGIIQELKAKGLVMTPYDESALSRGMLLLNVTDHLRELAYHLDEKDNVILIAPS
jgi:molybdopterin converting factor small subunit